MGRESKSVISLTFDDLERSDQGHLLKYRVYVRDSAIVTMKHVKEVIRHESDGIISFHRS